MVRRRPDRWTGYRDVSQRSGFRRTTLQPRGVPAQVIVHERRDEVVAVVVAGLAAQSEGNVRFLTGAPQQFGSKLLGEERICVAVVDQKLGKPGAVLDEGNGVVLSPGLLVAAKITAQRLGSPGHL